MSSETPEDKHDQPPVSERPSTRVATAWGPARNSLAAVHNVDVLLRRNQVAPSVLLELLPELRAGAKLLGEAFVQAQEGEEAAAGIGRHGAEQVGALTTLFDAIADGSGSREALATRAGAIADALEALVDLLALLDRAASPVLTEVSLALLARQGGRRPVRARGRALQVRFDESASRQLVVTDPSVMGRLISLVVAGVAARTPAASLVLRARPAPTPHFLMEPTRRADARYPLLSIHAMAVTPASDAAAGRVAELMGARLEWTESGARLDLDVSPVPSVG